MMGEGDDLLHQLITNELGLPELMEDGGLNSFDQIGGVVPSSSSSSSLGGNSGAETVGIGGGGESLGGIFNDIICESGT